MTSPKTYSLKISAATQNLAKVRSFVADYASQFGFTDREISDIRLAVDEACTNIIKHAYRFNNKRDIDIKLGFDENQMWISLTDSGQTFNPELYSKPDLQKQMKEKKRGGVGVFLISELMDNVEYISRDRLNEIRMYKNRA